MQNPLPETIESRLTELCNAIATSPEIRAARDTAESFLADDAAVSLLREVMTLGNHLQQLHQSGAELDDEDVERFEELRARSSGHPGIQAFHDAKDTLQNIANAVNGFVSRTLEKGSVPTAEEVFGSRGCGEGCGCH